MRAVFMLLLCRMMGRAACVYGWLIIGVPVSLGGNEISGMNGIALLGICTIYIYLCVRVRLFQETHKASFAIHP